MPLVNVNVNNSVMWEQSTTNIYGSITTNGPDSLAFNIAPDVTTYNEMYAVTLLLAASASQDIDLTSLTNLVCESFTFLTVSTVMVTQSGASSITIQPGASNGFPFNFTGTTPAWTLTDGACFATSESATGGITVDSTHKIITLTNNDGVNSSTVQLVLVGTA